MKKEYKNIKREDLENLALEVKSLVEEFFERENRACIIFLKGNLGAGKTTFTKEFGKVIGIKEDIISPTFVLRKDYENMIHVDGYRFEKEEEGKSLELHKEINQKGKIIVIEWPERFVKAVEINADISIEFEAVSEGERNVSIELINNL